MTTNQNTARRTAALLGAVVLTASLAACGNTADSDDDAAPNAGTETTAPAESTAPADDDASDDADDDATESDDDASESDDDSSDSAGTAGTADALNVTVQGQGVKALVLGDDSNTSGESTALNGKLISGPGGCFALQPGGQPELLLIGDAVEIGQNPPTLTLEDGTAIKVGDQLDAQGVQVSVADVEGIPQECSQGAADTAWVLQD